MPKEKGYSVYSFSLRPDVKAWLDEEAKSRATTIMGVMTLVMRKKAFHDYIQDESTWVDALERTVDGIAARQR